jgi:hypothetical protein
LTQSDFYLSRKFTLHFAKVSPTYAPLFFTFQSRLNEGEGCRKKGVGVRPA